MLKNLLFLAGFSTFVVIVLIGLDIFHAYTVSKIPKQTQTHVIPIDPSFDKKTIENLKKRAPISSNLTEKSSVISEDTQDTSNTTPTPTISITQTGFASSSAIPALTNQ